eukprot:m.357359 g.357359  ORF g.357359 m.357359 type:complete len:58 (-) comp16615_c0_seq2:1529-1702(-)
MHDLMFKNELGAHCVAKVSSKRGVGGTDITPEARLRLCVVRNKVSLRVKNSSFNCCA